MNTEDLLREYALAAQLLLNAGEFPGLFEGGTTEDDYQELENRFNELHTELTNRLEGN